MLSRDLEKAREAFRRRDVEATKQAHLQYAQEKHKGEGKYIKSIIYGGLDGIITTFAVVAGVAGAQLKPGIVLILGFANLIADGLSMAIGDFLSTKAENEYNKAEREREAWEVEHFPEGEMRELLELYTDKGIGEEDARNIVHTISKYKQAWIDIMMVEELGILESEESPLGNAVATFFSFAIFGFIPLAAHVLSLFIPAIRANAFWIACVLTGLTLFTLGALKVRITERLWFTSGLEMFIVGGLAALAAYGVGALLSGLANL